MVVAVAVAVASYDATVTVPAGCVITDIGFIATKTFDVGTSVVKFSAGTNGTNIIAATTVNNTNTDIAAGTHISVLANNKLHASGGQIAFADAAALHSSSERSIILRVGVTSAVLTAVSEFQAYVKYVALAE